MFFEAILGNHSVTIAANTFKNRIWYQCHRICYKREKNGMHNFHFSLPLHLIWDTILEVLLFFFLKREILTLAVLLTWFPYFYSKSVIVTRMHTHPSFTEVLFFHISSYLLFLVSALDFNLFQSFCSL